MNSNSLLSDSDASFVARRSVIPLWLKLAYTAFMAVLVPVYWANYGPTNFLCSNDARPQQWMPAGAYLVVWMLALFSLAYLPTHLLLKKLIRRFNAR